MKIENTICILRLNDSKVAFNIDKNKFIHCRTWSESVSETNSFLQELTPTEKGDVLIYI